MNPIFAWSGTFNDVTIVNNRYGKHMRRKRGSVKPAVLNEALKKSVDLNPLSNACAKAFKDAIDPFRKDFSDGSMWSRLVGIFKKHFKNNPTFDFSLLEGFEIHPKFQSQFSASAKVSFLLTEKPAMRIVVSSLCSVEREKYKLDGYRQALIVIFLDANLKATTFSEQVILPLVDQLAYNELTKSDYMARAHQEQVAKCPVPPGSKTAIIVVKSDPCLGKEVRGLLKLRRMKIAKVVRVG